MTFRKFACSYRYGDRSFGVTVPARSEAEALARLRAIGATGRVEGALIATIPAPGVGLVARAWAVVREWSRANG